MHAKFHDPVASGSPDTPEPLYNTVRYNTVLNITRIRVGPQMAIQGSFSYIIYAFYSRYNMIWIANTEIGLDPNNSVIKRLWCILLTMSFKG